MRAGFRLGLGHLVVFVAVALVLNGQFTWWVVYSLRESRDQLDLERTIIGSEAKVAALRLQLLAEQAADRLQLLPPGIIPAPLEPFNDVRVMDAPAVTGIGWVEVDGKSAFAWPVGRGRTAVAFLDPLAAHRWLVTIAPTLHLVQQGPPRMELPRVGLPAPFDHWAVTPDQARWDESLARYRRRVVVVVGEGVFFVLAIAGAVGLLWAVMRREGERERQHQNFVSAITHELKTPIAGIRLALETVLSGRVEKDGSGRFLTNALADAERLSDLVEKVLEVTRYAGGAHRLRIAIGDFSELVQEEVDVARRRAQARGVALEAEITPGIQVAFDPEATAIVLSNLLENALKYAQGPPPKVRASLRLEGGEAVLEVADNGVGIAPEELQSIFQPFYRSSDEVTRRTPGTGIGLYVAREIVAAHGGRLGASSDGRGKGATFRLTLPGASLLADEEFSEYDVNN